MELNGFGASNYYFTYFSKSSVRFVVLEQCWSPMNTFKKFIFPFITAENRALPKKQISLILPHPKAQTCARISEQQIVPLANTLTKMLPLGVSLTSEFKLEPREQPKFDYRVIQPKPNSLSAWRWRQWAQPTLFLSKPSVFSGFFFFFPYNSSKHRN